MMFTGIVEELGKVNKLEREGPCAVLAVRAPDSVPGAKIGDSIAVNGCCLTMKAITGEGFEADLMAETLDRTSLGAVKKGDPVNLERPMRFNDRLGGHIVQGHVDGTGKILSRTPVGDSEVVEIGLPAPLVRYVVEKGSIAVDGVSLTVVHAGDDRFSISLIPHTLAVTTLGFKGVGDLVNLEVDLVAKYVERLLRSEEGGDVVRQ